MAIQIAVFPKCFLEQMVAGEMSVFEWIEIASTLPHIAGVELYPYRQALASWEPEYLRRVKLWLAEYHLQMPMMCASPDFTSPDAAVRQAEIEKQKAVIEVTAQLGGQYCRVLSGQKRPGVSRAEGVRRVVDSIYQLLPHAVAHGITLIMENHYKDGFWQYPEFAQAKDVFLEIVGQIQHPHFAINYDPSNALIAGDDPYELLEAVKARVVTMHASDRSLEGGTLDDLKKFDADSATGYASFVKHGVIGEGLIDYDRIFSILKTVEFAGWISIEDGQDPAVGVEHLQRSAEFLSAKLRQHFGLNG
jgi:sugar phosphate isomerase/epimerase